MMYKQNTIQYEYVPEEEYDHLQCIFEQQIIPKVRRILSSKEITFQCTLIGSASRHMVTRRSDMTKGFDLDYNMFLMKCYEDPKDTKLEVMKAFDAVAPSLGFKHCEDSTTVITLKKVDRAHKRIRYSFDIALLFDDEDDIYYIHHDKDNERYLWSPRGGKLHIDKKVQCIQSYYNADVYDVIADDYLMLKNKEQNSEKRSFSLCVEAINNEYNHIQQI